MTIDDVMAVYGHVSRVECEEIRYWAGQGGPKRALEIGHYLGRSTSAILLSLPEGSTFTSIDHHNGDGHVSGSNKDEFAERMRPFVSEANLGGLSWIFMDFEVALPKLRGPFDFVFYDATHSPTACESFWKLVEPKLSEHCCILYDDADWPEMARLTELLLGNGFKDVTRFKFHRGEKEVPHSTAYTVMVMER